MQWFTRIFVVVLGGLSLAAMRQPGLSREPDLSGVYESIASDEALRRGLRHSGRPEDVVALPDAAERLQAPDVTQDPERNCQPIGPFRMMAREGVRIELAYARAAIVMLFEDIAHGHIRTIHLGGEHPDPPVPTWQGHSVAKWAGNTLTIETVGFHDRIWLNSRGLRNSGGLRLVEQVTPILGGTVLEYRMTAEDAAALRSPYSYTRYFQKINDEIREDICEP